MIKKETQPFNLLTIAFLNGRGGQTRTDDPLVPNQMRYQLRHTPKS